MFAVSLDGDPFKCPFQSSIAPKNDRNSYLLRARWYSRVPILDRPEERSQCRRGEMFA